jgi:mannose/fructose-specific phosphotransferase system component IIA
MTANGSARNSGDSGSNDSSTGQPGAGVVVIADLLGGSVRGAARP